MSKRNDHTQNVTEAMNKFLKELPDPTISNESTIRKEFIIQDEIITLQAQKTKGSRGMWWQIKS